MRIKKLITICLLLISVSLFAQEKTIEVTGVVTDMNKEPLVGVNAVSYTHLTLPTNSRV